MYTSPEQIRSLVEGRKIIAVGDIISYNLIKSGIDPDIFVFDGKEAKQPVAPEAKHLLERFKATQLSVRNPSGKITQELWDAVRKSLRSEERVKIFVDGEEDLAVTPFVLESDDNTIILYGLMDKGFVLINVNKDLKQKCKELLSKFRKGQ